MFDIYTRVSELVSENKQSLTEKEIFGGTHYARFLQRKAENIISGSFYNLRKIGFSITKKEEDEILRKLRVVVEYDSKNPDAAYCATKGNNKEYLIWINTASDLVLAQDGRVEKHYAILGLLYHEVGHLLFTNYPTLMAWQNQLERGSFYPPLSAGTLQTVNGINIQNRMQDKEFCRILSACASHIENVIEDAYIESEIKAMCPGKGLACINQVNIPLQEKAKTLKETADDEKYTPFMSLMNQISMYALFGRFYVGDYDGELLDCLDEALDVIDDVRYSRDPMKRCGGTNELLCIFFPYLEAEIERETQQQQQSSQQGPSQGGQNSGSTSGSGQSGQGQNGNDGSVSSSVADSIINQLNRLAQSAGASNQNKGATNHSVNDPTKPRNASAPGRQTTNGEAPGAGKGAGNEASSNLAAAERELDNLIDNMATSMAQEQAEIERTQELNDEASNIDCSEYGIPNVFVSVQRAESVSEENRKSYDRVSDTIKGISKDLQRGIVRILKDRREGGKRKNLPFGRRFEVTSVVHGDGKYFSKNKLPIESPKLGVGLLVDESGSTDGELIEAATRASLVIEDFCRELSIPHIINGYTSGYSQAAIFSYAEPNEIDSSNRYRITGMNARGGTPTKAALAYMMSRMDKLNVDIKLVIVITDGCSSDNYRSGEDSEIRRIVNVAKRKKAMVIAAGIGDDKTAIQKEFGDNNFIDITNLDELPEQLVSMIKRNLFV